MTDLFTLISKGAFKPGGAMNPRKKGKAESLSKELDEETKRYRAEIARASRWTQTALIQVMFKTTCRCGGVSLHPEIRIGEEKPLVRFEQVRASSHGPRIWERRLEPAEGLRHSLPLIIREIEAKACICPSCHPELFRGDLSCMK